MSLDDLMSALVNDSMRAKARREETTASLASMAQSMATQQVEAAKARPGASSPVGKGPVVAPGGMNGVSNLGNPLKGDWNVSEGYGARIHPITGKPGFHTGIDLSASEGTPIYAVSNGIIRKAVSGDSIYGNQIILGMGHQYQTMYGHLSKLAVKTGQRVKAGQIIGYVGSTGLSTGPHLHFETWHHGDSFNPYRVYKGKRYH